MAVSRGGIYAITNTLNGKQYVGSAVYFGRRWSIHRQHLTANRHHSAKLQRAWNKYGADAFTFTVLEQVEERSQLLAREQFWMDELAPWYNIYRTAGSPLGSKHTPEERARISAAGKRAWASPEYRERMRGRRKGVVSPEGIERRRQVWLGRAHTEETKEKFRAANARWLENTPDAREQLAHNRGKVMSEEQKAKISAAQKGHPKSPETRQRMREAQKRRPPISAETRAKMAASLRKRPVSEETRARLAGYAAARKGCSLSAETKAKMSTKLRGRVVSETTREKLRNRITTPETRAKLSAALKGKPGKKPSAEDRAKLSEIRRQAWANGLYGPPSDATRAKLSAASRKRWHKADAADAP